MRTEKAIKGKEGMSLVEVMVAMGIFTLLAGALFSIVLMGRRLSEGSVYENLAATAAQGYIEQIKAIQYPILLESVTDPSGTPLPTMIDVNTPDPIYINQKNEKTITVSVDSNNNPTQTMKFWITPKITNFHGATGRDALAVELDFEWEARDKGTTAIRSSVVRFIRSSVN